LKTNHLATLVVRKKRVSIFWQILYFVGGVTSVTRYGEIFTQLTQTRTQFRPGLPDFSWHVVPKPEKCTKSTQNAPNDHKIAQVSEKYSIISITYIYQHFPPPINYPNWDFGFETKPSGNPEFSTTLFWPNLLIVKLKYSEQTFLQYGAP
jgi:hypothetical protein